MKSPKKRTWHVDLVSLRLFVAVCEESSIAHAAERESIAASAVSKRITDIEDAIGTPLLIRHRSGITMTAAGEALLQHARMLLLGVEKMQGELSEYAAGVRGHIHIYASVSAVVEFLPDDISTFLSRHDNIKIDMEERVSSSVVRTVEENGAAIGVCWDLAETRGLQLLPYKRDHLHVAVHPDNPLARRQSVSFEETLAFDQIAQPPESIMNVFLRRLAAAAGKPLVNRIHVATIEAACRLVRANLGVSILPLEAVQPNHSALGLRMVPLSDSWAHRQLVICMRDYEALPMPTRLFVDFLRTDR